MLTTSYPRCLEDYPGKFIHNLASEIVKRGINVSIVVPHDVNTRKKEKLSGVDVNRFKYWFTKKGQKITYGGGTPDNLRNSLLAKIQMPFFLLFFFLKALKVGRKCDVIHAHWALSGLVGIFIKKFVHIPVYLTIRGSATMLMPKFLLKIVIKNVDLVNIDVLYLKRKIDQLGINYKYSDVKLKYIDKQKFNPDTSGKKIINEFNLKNKIIITSIGRFVPIKGLDILIRAIPDILKEINNTMFLFVGDGPLREEYEKLVHNLKIDNYVIFTGYRSDVNEFLAASDIFVTTSKFDNCFSNVILEAMNCGKPCIITNEGDTDKFWTHEHDSYLYKRDSKSLSNAIITLLKNKSLFKKLKLNASNFIETYGFTKEKTIPQTIKNYKKLLTESK